MRVLLLPLVAELRDRELLAVGHEDRVVAEALAAARLAGDPALEDPGAADLLPVRRDRDELRDVAFTTSAIRSTSSRASSSRRSSSVSWTLRRLSSRVISRLSIRASAPSTASITRAGDSPAGIWTSSSPVSPR